MILVPFCHRWVIKRQELVECLENGRPLSSAASGVGENLEYYFRLFPNGINQNDVGNVKFCMYMKMKERKAYKRWYNVTVESADYLSSGVYVFNRSLGTSFIMCSRNELLQPASKFFKDGKLIFKIFGTIGYVDPEYNAPKQEWNGRQIGEDLWVNQESLKDFTLVVRGRSISIHKTVFAACSSVFEAALSNFAAKESSPDMLAIQDFSYHTIFVAVQLMYERSVTTALSLDDMLGLWKFFVVYDIPSLKDMVERKLVAMFDESNIVKISNFSATFGQCTLKEKCSDYLKFCIEHHLPMCNFLLLNKDFALQLLFDQLFTQLPSRI